jgi:hypothetical protein
VCIERLGHSETMSQRPGQAGLPGPAEQFNVVQPVRRLFFMATSMAGLPVAALHD